MGLEGDAVTALGQLTGVDVAAQRDWGTAATSCAAAAGGAALVRVHNVDATRQVLSVMDAVLSKAPTAEGGED